MAALAHRQHGKVARWQLLSLSFDDNAIRHRVTTGRLFRVHLGVYAVGRPPKTPLERAGAALLACGEGAALSHRTGGTLWGWWKEWETPLHTIVVGDRRPQGIRTHRVTGRQARDPTVQLGLRVTSPARTRARLCAARHPRAPHSRGQRRPPDAPPADASARRSPRSAALLARPRVSWHRSSTTSPPPTAPRVVRGRIRGLLRHATDCRGRASPPPWRATRSTRCSRPSG